MAYILAMIERPNTADSELITFRDFGKLMQVSIRQLYLMEADGRLGPERVQIGRAVRFKRREVEGWIAVSCPPRAEWLVQQRNDHHVSERPVCPPGPTAARSPPSTTPPVTQETKSDK